MNILRNYIFIQFMLARDITADVELAEFSPGESGSFNTGRPSVDVSAELAEYPMSPPAPFKRLSRTASTRELLSADISEIASLILGKIEAINWSTATAIGADPAVALRLKAINSYILKNIKEEVGVKDLRSNLNYLSGFIASVSFTNVLNSKSLLKTNAVITSTILLYRIMDLYVKTVALKQEHFERQYKRLDSLLNEAFEHGLIKMAPEPATVECHKELMDAVKELVIAFYRLEKQSSPTAASLNTEAITNKLGVLLTLIYEERHTANLHHKEDSPTTNRHRYTFLKALSEYQETHFHLHHHKDSVSKKTVKLSESFVNKASEYALPEHTSESQIIHTCNKDLLNASKALIVALYKLEIHIGTPLTSINQGDITNCCTDMITSLFNRRREVPLSKKPEHTMDTKDSEDSDISDGINIEFTDDPFKAFERRLITLFPENTTNIDCGEELLGVAKALVIAFYNLEKITGKSITSFSKTKVTDCCINIMRALLSFINEEAYKKAHTRMDHSIAENTVLSEKFAELLITKRDSFSYHILPQLHLFSPHESRPSTQEFSRIIRNHYLGRTTCHDSGATILKMSLDPANFYDRHNDIEAQAFRSHSGHYFFELISSNIENEEKIRRNFLLVNGLLFLSSILYGLSFNFSSLGLKNYTTFLSAAGTFLLAQGIDKIHAEVQDKHNAFKAAKQRLERSMKDGFVNSEQLKHKIDWISHTDKGKPSVSDKFHQVNSMVSETWTILSIAGIDPTKFNPQDMATVSMHIYIAMCSAYEKTSPQFHATPKQITDISISCAELIKDNIRNKYWYSPTMLIYPATGTILGKIPDIDQFYQAIDKIVHVSQRMHEYELQLQDEVFRTSNDNGQIARPTPYPSRWQSLIKRAVAQDSQAKKAMADQGFSFDEADDQTQQGRLAVRTARPFSITPKADDSYTSVALGAKNDEFGIGF